MGHICGLATAWILVAKNREMGFFTRRGFFQFIEHLSEFIRKAKEIGSHLMMLRCKGTELVRGKLGCNPQSKLIWIKGRNISKCSRHDFWATPSWFFKNFQLLWMWKYCYLNNYFNLHVCLFIRQLMCVSEK